MAYDFLYEVEDGVATITLNRPETLNALTFEIYAQLRDLMAELRRDDHVRVVIVTGAGDAFCAGGDVYKIIGELLERDMRSHLEFARMTGALIHNYAFARQTDYSRGEWDGGGRWRGDRAGF